MRYKMIVLDLDGTLTNNKKEITPTYQNKPSCKHKLQEYMSYWHLVALLTASSLLAEELKLKDNGGYILAFNGGKIIDCTNNEFFLNRSWTNSLYLSSFKKPKKLKWKS